MKDHQSDYYEQNVIEYEEGFVFKRTTNRAFLRKAKKIVHHREVNSQLTVGNVLEIGAGTGLLSFFLIDLIDFDSYTVSDLTKEMLEKASIRIIGKSSIRSSNVKFEVIDLNLIGTEIEYDLIVGSDIIHHLEDPVAVLRRLWNATSDGGLALILESNPYNPLNILRIIGQEHEVRGILSTTKNLSKWFVEAGWTNVEVLRVSSFTPGGPRFLSLLLDVIDQLCARIPFLNRLDAQHIVIAHKSIPK